MIFKVSTVRPALEYRFGDQDIRWEYDIVDLRLMYEGLEERHHLRDGESLKPPTLEFLDESREALKAKGLAGCTNDLAYRMYNVVQVQFAALCADIQQQLGQV